MTSDWVVVYSSNQLYDTELVKSILDENEIENISMNKQDSAYLFGEIEVYVSSENAFKARQLIIQLKGE
jgi:hypothetical protein